MRNIFLLLLITAATISMGATTKYFTRDGVIKFISDAPLEKNESVNKEVNIILDPSTSSIAFKVVMKSFSFEKQAMKDHFNTKYLETDTYPNATFEGKVSGVPDWTKNGTYKATAEGKLTIHGVTKTVKQEGTIIIDNGTITVSSDFTILLTDFKVAVPTNYVSKISNIIEIKVNGKLTPYQR